MGQDFDVPSVAAEAAPQGHETAQPQSPGSVDTAELVRRIEALEAENAKLKRGEWFYEADDPDNGASDWSDPLDYSGENGPMQICGAREVERFWVARVPTTDDDAEYRRFATEAEALAALSGGQTELDLATQPNDEPKPSDDVPEERSANATEGTYQ